MTVVNTAVPVISGTAQQGQRLSTTNGTWTFSLDYLTYVYTWLRCDAAGASCVAIPGATSSTYVLTTADVGHTIRSEVTATEHTTAPPGTAYFVEDWSSGNYSSSRWDLLFSYTNPGFFSTPLTASPDGRVSVVNDPAGGGGKCARLEIRDSDPDWASGAGLDKSEIDTGSATKTWNGAFSFGIVRWFEWDIYLPYGAEKFELPHGTDQPYFSLFGLHPPGPTGWSAMHLGWEAFQFNAGGDSAGYKNVHLNFRVEGGTWNNGGPNPNDRFYNLLPLTDASGNRVMANHNRWIHLVWGAKFNPDATGWLDIWCDGVNVFPQHSRATSWNTDGQNYFKYGLYRRSGNTFPETGRSVAYFGRTTIGVDRPF